MHVFSQRWAVIAVPAAASLVLAASAVPASAIDSYTIPLHQPVPITAASYGEKEAACAGVPASKDGWHFVLPGNTTVFKKLTVTFEPGGTQVITVFGPPTGKHAYAASAAGAKLTAASAVVEGGSVEWFNLSHTCPASVTPSPTPSKTPSGTPSKTPSGSASASPSPSRSASPSASKSASPSPSASVSRSGGSTPSGSGTPSSTASSPAPVTGGGGDLADTGADLPVALLSALAAALVAAGGVLVVRRRRAR
ncbi:LPXTG cell wall anchor domain-containing protein [Streptomyces sp. NPDC091371]|uniref:LPXTG cell wall anchor domain-containing protein n=1 Tax=Streptomyces sp. NPDC091371 TaxID=3155303 RepID=UPI00341962BE